MTMLNEKIYEHFAIRGIFEEQFEAVLASLKQTDQVKWTDSLTRNKEKMFVILNRRKDDLPDEFTLQLLDSIGIPRETIDQSVYDAENARIKSKIDYMSSAIEGKFTHVISLPWNIVESNADSVAGDRLVWQPPVIKFMLQDYKMHATSRKPNYWAMILSATVVIVTILAFIKVRRNRMSIPT
jgi:hypothetical protein